MDVIANSVFVLHNKKKKKRGSHLISYTINYEQSIHLTHFSNHHKTEIEVDHVHQIKDFKRTIVTQRTWNSKKYRHGWTENTEQVTPQYTINNREACSNSHQMLILKKNSGLKNTISS